MLIPGVMIANRQQKQGSRRASGLQALVSLLSPTAFREEEGGGDAMDGDKTPDFLPNSNSLHRKSADDKSVFFGAFGLLFDTNVCLGSPKVRHWTVEFVLCADVVGSYLL